ncbi:butyrophilin-like protein 2 [Acanthopagrus latus]|uniref:butyrophilin-like protein 2 n=1 Tax=Acanthopagrus latus TaxID=8177 RepID=UPI00187BF6B9|nr:butyrophilin-like protein 2 [Acanthopagrus latus]
MICRILLLISLNCVCGTFVVNVTQTSYQAEENHNITLEWTFTTTADTPTDSLHIFCEMKSNQTVSVLFEIRGGVEIPESQDQQFVGRVQWDKDVLRDGRLRLHVSRLRTEDSGRYLCDVETHYDGGSGECRLNVSAARDQPEPERSKPASRGRIVLCCVPVLTAAVVVGLFVHKVCC